MANKTNQDNPNLSENIKEFDCDLLMHCDEVDLEKDLRAPTEVNMRGVFASGDTRRKPGRACTESVKVPIKR